MAQITANTSTALKKSTAQTSTLDPEQVSTVEQGRTFPISDYEPAEGGHYLVTLQFDAGQWYIFKDHWDCSWIDDNGSSDGEFTALKQLKETSTNLSQLNEEQTRQLQKILQKLGYYTGTIDGIVGDLTRNALQRFKKDHFLAYPNQLGTTTVESLISEYQAHPGNDLLPNVEPKNRQGVIDAVIDTCNAQGLPLIEQKAYVLATIEHETNNTFEPVRESYWFSEQWRRDNLRYYPYYGRGFIQLTWKSNYAKYEQITGQPLVENPDLVMDYDLSVFICVHGMANGVFTHHALPKFINANQVDYYNARKVVNDSDKAEKIADLARKWQRTL